MNLSSSTDMIRKVKHKILLDHLFLKVVVKIRMKEHLEGKAVTFLGTM